MTLCQAGRRDSPTYLLLLLVLAPATRQCASDPAHIHSLAHGLVRKGQASAKSRCAGPICCKDKAGAQHQSSPSSTGAAATTDSRRARLPAFLACYLVWLCVVRGPCVEHDGEREQQRQRVAQERRRRAARTRCFSRRARPAPADPCSSSYWCRSCRCSRLFSSCSATVWLRRCLSMLVVGPALAHLRRRPNEPKRDVDEPYAWDAGGAKRLS